MKPPGPPKTRAIASASIGSPTGVPVPWHLIDVRRFTQLGFRNASLAVCLRHKRLLSLDARRRQTRRAAVAVARTGLPSRNGLMYKDTTASPRAYPSAFAEKGLHEPSGLSIRFVQTFGMPPTIADALRESRAGFVQADKEGRARSTNRSFHTRQTEPFINDDSAIGQIY